MRCFRTRNLLLSKKCVPLHCVFHSIRFKVNKGWSTAVLLFLCNRYEKVCNTSINTCSAMMQMYSRGLDKFAEIKKEMI